jgi:hypothetical protein
VQGESGEGNMRGNVGKDLFSKASGHRNVIIYREFSHQLNSITAIISLNIFLSANQGLLDLYSTDRA